MNSDGRSKTWEGSDVNTEEDTPSDPMTRSLWGRTPAPQWSQNIRRELCWLPSASYKPSPFQSPVWMKVCFFMSDFWWNLLPQY